MSKNKVDSLQEISDSNLQEILLPKKGSTNKKVRKDSDKDMLATSSAQESGSESLGEAHLVRPTPSDSHAHVKVDSKGKLQFSIKSIAKENKELKEKLVALQSQLEEASKSPRIQPDPSPAKDSLTEGLERFLSKDQFDTFCKYVGDQVAATVKSGQDISPVLPLLSDAPGPSKAVSSQVGTSGKKSARLSQKDILGTSMGLDDSEDDLGDLSSDDKEG